jgi:hypothetical protein
MAREYKRIGVLVGESPIRSTRAKEAIRLSVGLTLRNPDVHLFLVGEGLDGLQGGGEEQGQGPEFRKHLDAYLDMGCHLVLEGGAAASQRGLPGDLGAETWSREEIYGFLTQCDEAVIVGD